MELADCGSPEKLAKIIHKYIPASDDGSTNLNAVTEAIGITEINYAETENFEGVLVTTPDKSKGIISVNAKSHPTRQRYTIGHECGHFLIPTHDKRVTCMTTDLKAYQAKTKRDTAEAEANAFASELLMPTERISRQINNHIGPEIEKILTLAEKYNVSKEAMTRRYIDLTPHCCAAMWAKDGLMFGYPTKANGFPFIGINPADKMPPHITEVEKDMKEGDVSEMFEVDPHYFLSYPEKARGKALYAQVMRQARGFSTIVLSLESE